MTGTDTEDIVIALEELTEALKKTKPPTINFAPQIPSPDIKVEAPHVTVESQSNSFEIEVTKRDANGDIKKLLITPIRT